MPIDRTTILRGPCVIIYDGATVYSKDDITVEFGYDTFNIETSVHGKKDERFINRYARVTLTPAGEWKDLTKLLPYDNVTFKVGDSIFGSDKPLVLHGRDGHVITFASGAITRMPNVILSTTKTTFGQMEFLCIGKNNSDWVDANSFVTFTNASFPADSFDLTKVYTIPYTTSWGAKASPWNAVPTQDGFEIVFDLQTTPIEVDAQGVVDHTFSRLTAMAKAKLVGVTPAQLDAELAWQGTPTAQRGASANAIGADLVIQGALRGQPKFTLSAAAMKVANYGFGPATQRIGEVQFIGTIPAAGGTLFVATTV